MPKRDPVWDCTACGRVGNLTDTCSKCGRDRGNATVYDEIDFERTTGGHRLPGAPEERPRAASTRSAAVPVAPSPRKSRRRSPLLVLAIAVLLVTAAAAAPWLVRWGGTRGKGGPLVRTGAPARGAWVMVVHARVENGKKIARVRTSDHEVVDLVVDSKTFASLEKGQIRDATFSRFGGLQSLGRAQPDR